MRPDSRHRDRHRDRSRSRSPDRHRHHRSQDKDRDRIRVRHDDRHHRSRDEGDRRPDDRRDRSDRTTSSHDRDRTRRRSGDRSRSQTSNRVRDPDVPHQRPESNRADDSNTSTKPPEPKKKPDFGQSGKLAEDTNTFNGVVVKYNEPPDAKCPKRKWRLYPFKAGETLEFIPIHHQSAYLLGRDRRVADIPIDHPSCSMQHAAVQFRAVQFERDDGSIGKRVRPYVIDLESSNGTYLNNEKIVPKKYYQLFEKDVLKFGFSSRDYVVLTEDFKDEDEVDAAVGPLLPEG